MVSSIILLPLLSIFLHVNARTCPPLQSAYCITEASDTEGQTCGTRGKIGHITPGSPKEIHHCVAPTLEACRDSCLSAPACQSFRWNSENFACSRYRVPISSLPFQSDPHSPSVIYDAGCYDAKPLSRAFNMVITNASDSSNVGDFVVQAQGFGPHQGELQVAASDPEIFSLNSSAAMISIGNDAFKSGVLSMTSDGSNPDQLWTFTKGYMNKNPGIYGVMCALQYPSPDLTCQNGQGTQFYTNSFSQGVVLFGLGAPGNTEFTSVSVQATCPTTSTTSKLKEDITISRAKSSGLKHWNQ